MRAVSRFSIAVPTRLVPTARIVCVAVVKNCLARIDQTTQKTGAVRVEVESHDVRTGSALRMKIDSNDLRTRIALRDRHRLAARSRATIQYPRPFADKHCNQLRAFVLNGDLSVSQRLAPGDIAGANTSCRGKQRARVDDNAFLLKCVRGSLIVKPNRCHRDGLVVLADAVSGSQPILFGPTCDQPNRMREGLREIFSAEIFPRRLFGELRQLAQKRIHEWSRRPF